FVTNIQQNPDIPNRAKEKATTQLTGGIPFVSEADLEKALDETHARNKTTDAAIASYQDARLDGLRAALGILAVMAIVALLLAGRMPTVQPGRESPQRDRAGPDEPEADTFI